jgi:hypothetical protein
MRQLALYLLILLYSNTAFAQIRVLFVNDNKAFSDNTVLVRNAISAVGAEIIEFREFDAVNIGTSPTLDLMQAHDLVIWYTSTDGVDLLLWNGNDTDPEGLKTYLDEGGMLLIMGNDFLFDRYQLPPKDFVEGDFPYDYLGIKTYEAQSFGNDLGQGVPQMDFVENLFIEQLPTPLRWTFETLWWADAVEPNDFGIPIYQMGPQNYQLAGKPSGILLRSTPNNFYPVISLYFDPALIQTDAQRNQLMSGLIHYFRDFKLSLSTNQWTEIKNSFTLYPNPAGDYIWLSQKHTIDSNPQDYFSAQYTIINSLGQVVNKGQWNNPQNPTSILINHLHSGAYWIVIQRNGMFERILFMKK